MLYNRRLCLSQPHPYPSNCLSLCSYTVDANTSTSGRTATLTVAGQTLNVLQGAAFLDVPLNHPFYAEIGKLSAHGVTLGCGGGDYCPDDVATREQMAAYCPTDFVTRGQVAAFLVRAFAL